MPATDDPRSTALRLLARRDFSCGELRTRLSRRASEASAAVQDIEATLDDLESDGQLSDERFVEGFVRSRLHRGQGPLRIRHDLRARGVDADVLDRHLTFSTEFWVERVVAIRQRRFGEALPASAAERGRQARFLAQRGFPSDVIFAAFKAG